MAVETASSLSSLLAASQERGVVWVDALHYGRRLFTPGEDVWAESSRYIELTRQVQRLIGSEVLTVRLDDFHRSAPEASGSAVERLRGKRPAAVLRTLLRDSPATTRAVECVTALRSLYSSVPIVLELSGGSGWLQWASGVAGDGDGAAAVDADTVEKTATYLADTLRSFSEAGLAGIVLDVRGVGADDLAATAALHQPVLNVAAYYGWSMGLLADEAAGGSSVPVQFVLCPALPGAGAGGSGDGAVIGSGLNDAFWSGQAGDVAGPGLWFGEIPEDAVPESVLQSLERLRG